MRMMIMEPNEIDKMNRLEEAHWWFQGKKYVIKSVMSRINIPDGRFLDIGCGTGMFLKELGKDRTSYGVDVSDHALSYCAKKVNSFLIKAFGANLPFKDGVFTFVSLLDMIEHVENDFELLKEVYRVCRPQSIVVITVPAFNFLWGTHDVSHHHKRRYKRNQLRDICLSAGFLLERLTYTNFFIFFPVLLRRISSSKSSDVGESDLRRVPAIVNGLLKCIYRFEAFYLKRGRFPFGVSLLAVLRKP
jgi:ubiquinone/menaquinone biosynthesis C-methylase UbiE